MNYMPHEYECMRRWGTYHNQSDLHIKAMQQLAAIEEAPITAIYHKQEGGWAIAADIDKNDKLRRYITGMSDETAEEVYARWDRITDRLEDTKDMLDDLVSTDFFHDGCWLTARAHKSLALLDDAWEYMQEIAADLEQELDENR